jgi:hypothetical protein
MIGPGRATARVLALDLGGPTHDLAAVPASEARTHPHHTLSRVDVAAAQSRRSPQPHQEVPGAHVECNTVRVFRSAAWSPLIVKALTPSTPLTRRRQRSPQPRSSGKGRNSRRLTGSGHDVSGTGKANGLRSTYTYCGTFNTKPGVFSVTLTGSYAL